MVGAVVRHVLLKSDMFWRKALTLFATMTNSMSAAPLWLRSSPRCVAGPGAGLGMMSYDGAGAGANAGATAWRAPASMTFNIDINNDLPGPTTRLALGQEEPNNQAWNFRSRSGRSAPLAVATRKAAQSSTAYCWRAIFVLEILVERLFGPIKSSQGYRSRDCKRKAEICRYVSKVLVKRE